MKKGNSLRYLLSGLLILFSMYQPLPAAGDQQPDENFQKQKIDQEKSGSAPGTTGITIADELREMRSLINQQTIQIERLQKTVEQQQWILKQVLGNSRFGGTNKSEAAEAAVSVVHPGTEENSGVPKREIDAAAQSAAQSTQRLEKVEADVAAGKKLLEEKGKQLGNFNLSGDIRVRYEPFIQDGAADRHRERFRARLNFIGKLSDEFSGGVSLATGALDDPVSTNQTMTGFFNLKNFGLDRAFITYKPKYAKFLKLDAGKFAFPWYRTPLTFDNDLNPEGFAETLSFDLNASSLQNITLIGFQLPFNEVAGGHDSFVLGGQLQAHFRINSKARLSLYAAGINVSRADPIAIALGNGSFRPSLPTSNTLVMNSNGTVTGFATRFAWLDAIMKLDIAAGTQFPATLQFHFVNNVRGSRERSGYWAEGLIGRNREAGDVQLGYAFVRIEKDAVIGAWNESDLRSPTNVLNHRLHFGYLIRNNVSGQFTAWIGRLANPLDNVGLVPPGVRAACTGANTSNCEDPYLKRLQFDLTYRF